MTAAAELHRHLDVVEPRTSDRRDRHRAQRWTVVGLASAAVGSYVASLFVPWWDITLFAPQYPQGLKLSIGLRAIGGDVREIDILNHYIGMSHLELAAQFERQWAAWGVGLLGFMVLAFTLLPGKRLSGLMMIPALLFPAAFLADSFWWLYKFGHHLDPHAPLRFKPFTPHLFGVGIIGQFSTRAVPDVGFWLAVCAVGLLFAGVLVRRRVCASCGRRSTCGGICPTALVGPHAGEPAREETARPGTDEPSDA
jgi:hypothetical protein